MRSIPDEAMGAFCEGEDEENAKPENNTPTARAMRALGSSPFNPVSGPYATMLADETLACFVARNGLVLTRHVKGRGTVCANEAITATANSERHPTNLAALHAWLDNFDGNVSVRVFGVPVDAKRLHGAFVAFSETPTHYATASMWGVANDGTPAKITVFVLDGGGTIVGITALRDARSCVAVWPIPDGVRE